MLHALDAVVLTGAGLHAVQLHPQLLVQHLVDQRAFAAAADAGDTDERPQRERHVDAFQVVLPCAPHRQVFAVALPPVCRQLDALFAAEVLSRQAVGVGHHLRRRTGGHHLPAQLSGAGTDVDEPVGGAHGVLIVLHHDQGVAQIPEAAQRGQQLVVIPLVQADGRLIQNIQHTHQAAADLGGKADTLALAAGQGTGCTGQGEIAQSHGLQKAQPCPDFLAYLGGDELLVARQFQTVEEGQRLVHRQLRGLEDGQTAHRHRQRLRPQTAALAGGAGTLGQILLDLLLAGVALRLAVPPLQIVADALERLMQHALAPGLVVVQLQLLPAGAVEDDLLHRVAQLAVRLA